MAKVLDVRNISKSFGALKAVDGVSFELNGDEVLGIAGPNGSGKSTLFNALTSVPFRADQGEVWLEGRPLHGLSPHLIARAGLCRTFQRETAFTSRTVFENVLVARLHQASGPDNDDAASEVRAALEFCGIEHARWSMNAAEASVFEKKLMMIASALAMNPKVLLLDEPASGLTQPEIVRTDALIRAVRDRGIAVVLIEHVLPLLLGISDRLMVLNEGREITTGLPDDVVKDPRVIASYLGTRGTDD